MKKLAGLLFIFAMDAQQARPADACGVKLTIRSAAPRRAVAHTSNPSEILLLGSPPSRLERDLTAAGHHVEVESNVANAKRKDYAVVIVDSDLQAQARSSFNPATIVVRSNDVAMDTHSVESLVARTPTSASTGLVVVRAAEPRVVVAAGPPQDPHKVVAARDPKDSPSEPDADHTPAVAPTPVKIAPATKPVETKPVETKPVEKIETKPVEKVETRPAPDHSKPTVVAKTGTVHDEVYFTLNATKFGGTKGLDKAAKWLMANPDVNVMVEGHADPSGTPEDNMVLAQHRADWVHDYLVAAGVDASRLEVISYGDTKLRYGRSDARNRRVAIVVK